MKLGCSPFSVLAPSRHFLAVSLLVILGLGVSSAFGAYALSPSDAYQGGPTISGDWVGWGESDMNTSTSSVVVYNLATKEIVTLDSAVDPDGVSLPAMSGQFAVWCGDKNGQANLWGYDLLNRQEFSISKTTVLNLAAGGGVAVWGESGNSLDPSDPLYHPPGIYAYDLAAKREIAVSSTGIYPATDGQYVVWKERDSYYDYIYGYDLATGQKFKVSQQNAPSVRGPGGPAISGNYVVWSLEGDNVYTVYGYNLTTGSQFTIGAGSSPAIDGNTVMYLNDNDLYAYDLQTRQSTLVYSGLSCWDTGPQISGQTVVWEDGRGDNPQIWVTTIPEPASISLLAVGGLALLRRRS
jgi:hypothetical protein